MLIPFLTALGRWRRFVLVAVLLLTVAIQVGTAGRHPGPGVSLAVPVLAIGLVLLAVVVQRRFHPARLVAHPDVPAFAAPVSPYLTLNACFATLLGGSLMGDSVADLAAGRSPEDLDTVFVVVYLLVIALSWYLAWVSPGVSVRPDGVLDRQPLGRRFVPWDAIAADHPAVPASHDTVALSVTRPQAVIRSGLARRGDEIASTADTAFLARVINEYAADPAHRPAIGTEAELRRVTAAVGD